jgi:hypothetical protein
MTVNWRKVYESRMTDKNERRGYYEVSSISIASHYNHLKLKKYVFDFVDYSSSSSGSYMHQAAFFLFKQLKAFPYNFRIFEPWILDSISLSGAISYVPLTRCSQGWSNCSW